MWFLGIWLEIILSTVSFPSSGSWPFYVIDTRPPAFCLRSHFLKKPKDLPVKQRNPPLCIRWRTFLLNFGILFPCLVLSTLLFMALLAFSCSLICLECEYSPANDLDMECLRSIGRGFPGVSGTTISLTVFSSLTSTWYCDLFLFLDLRSSLLFKCSTRYWSLSNFLFNSIWQIFTDKLCSVWCEIKM